MDRILDLHRHETPQPDPKQFLERFPGAFIQYFDDTPAHDPRKALSTPYFDHRVASHKQCDGCGVYFSPNAFIGARRLDCLRRVQAVFLDIDCAREVDQLATDKVDRRKGTELLSLLGSSHPPHSVIETKHGLQPIWRVLPTRLERDVRLFHETMASLLARFHGDGSARDLTRTLRLPGYRHLKNPESPFTCRLVHDTCDIAPYDLQDLLDAHYASSLPLPRTEPPHAREPAAFADLDVTEVIRTAAAEAGIAVEFRRNRDGSRQIIENGQVTSGFISARGNFGYSASGKPRKGGPVQLVQFYLGLDRSAAKRWLTDRFGPPSSQASPAGFPHQAAPNGHVSISPDCLARDAPRAIDCFHFP